MATETPTSAPKITAYSSGQVPQGQKPIVRGPRPKKQSEYGKQLSEKQKARFEYGLREGQFSRYFKEAAKSTVSTGQALFTNLELRLDNVVYRAGIAKSRKMARQLVGHGLVLVNDKRVNVPGYRVKEGDVITLKKPDLFEYNKETVVPNWLSYNQKTKAAKVERQPKADDIVTDINAQLIIEYYSR
jgi:small subunit ribosomal protein S4